MVCTRAIFTARKRSFGARQYFHKHLSVHRGECASGSGNVHPLDTHTPWTHPPDTPRTHTPMDTQLLDTHPVDTPQQAGGTHPTRMLSCLYEVMPEPEYFCASLVRQPLNNSFDALSYITRRRPPRCVFCQRVSGSPLAC